MNYLDGISSIEELKITSQRVLVRADLDAEAGSASDSLLTLKLESLLPTLRSAAERGARVIVAAHRGQPKRRDSALSLERIGTRLSELSGWEVFLPDDCLSDAAKRVIGDLRSGQVCLLENLRFHRGETQNDENFARSLAAWCDVYVNDAFACSHEHAASLSALPRLIPMRGAGLGLVREVSALSRLTTAPVRPYVGILGGVANQDRLDLLDLWLAQCDKVCVGGGLAWALLAAAGHDLGDTPVPAELMPRCRSLLDQQHGKLLLPVDVRTARSSLQEAHEEATPGNIAVVRQIPAGHHALDVGPETVEHFAKTIAPAKTIVYTGLMSTPRVAPAFEGTALVLQRLAQSSGFSVLFGDESVRAAQEAGAIAPDGIGHISLGGEATLAFLAGKRMPGIEALRGASNE